MSIKKRGLSYVISESNSNQNLARKLGLMDVRAESDSKENVRHVIDQAGRRLVDFNRCSYLNLDSHELLIKGAKEAIDRYGSVQWSAASTRLTYGMLSELEASLVEIFGNEMHLSVGSNLTSINSSALQLLAVGGFTGGKKPVVVFDKRAHASMSSHKAYVASQTDVFTIEHNDLNELEIICKKHLGRKIAFICDGVYSMGGKAPLLPLEFIQSKYGILLYVDDAHGMSISGEHGKGFAWTKLQDADPERTIVVTSLNKGFGSTGALFTSRSSDLVDTYKKFAMSMAFSNMPSVAAVGASLASARIHLSSEIVSLQQELQLKLTLFDKLYKTEYLASESAIRFVHVGEEKDAILVGKSLLDRGFFVGVTFFPTVPHGGAGLRICLTAKTSTTDIEFLTEALNELVGGI